jgi:hypothetical protein
MKQLQFDTGALTATVLEDGKVLGTFKLFSNDEEEEKKAERLGVDMGYAQYAYQSAMM